MLSAGGVSWAEPKADRTDPRVRFTTPRDAVVVGAPADHDLTMVRGTATHDRSGVKGLDVLFLRCPQYRDYGGGAYSCGGVIVGAEPSDLEPLREGTPQVTCKTSRSCAWNVRAALVPGEYIVSAIDRAGNQGGNYIHVSIV